MNDTQIRIPPGVLDLGIGDPSFDLLPVDLLHRSAEAYFARRDPHPLQYGHERGDSGLRAALAGVLSPAYGFPVDPDGLLITAGASQALDLLCTLYTDPGDVIFVEEPSYFLALHIFHDHHLQVVSIPVDENGLSLDALENELARSRPRLVYTIPSFQNPSGCTLTAERRRRLAELAHIHNFVVIADEVYQLLGYDCDPPPAILNYAPSSLAQPHNLISLGSFSKILAPGLRLGWIQAHPERIQVIAAGGLLRSGGGLGPYTSALVRPLVEDGGLAANIAHLKQVYTARRDALGASLRLHLPKVSYRLPTGGFFYWVQFPDGIDAEALLRSAANCQVAFRPGARFSSRSGLNDYARLCFTYYSETGIDAAVQRLAVALAAFTS